MPPTPSANKEATSFGKRLFAASDAKRIQTALEKKPEATTAAGVVLEANKIFGINGWSVSISNVWDHGQDKDKEDDKFVAYASAAVRVLLKDGACREGMGFASGKHTHSYGAKIMAKQNAQLEATKQALRAFGPGLAQAVKDTKSNK